MKENFRPKNLFADERVTEAELKYEPMTNNQLAQGLVEHGVFKDQPEEESKELQQPLTPTMDVDEKACSSDQENQTRSAAPQTLANNEGLSDQILQDIKDGHDCFVSDQELLGAKKHLTSKFTPSSIVSQLKAKLPAVENLRISEAKITETKDLETQRSKWHFSVGFHEQNIVGQAEDFSK